MTLQNNQFSDYLVFADESGDHGLQEPLDKDFPVFALVFVIVKKTDYIEKIVPEFQKIKMKYWGHDQVIFHEHDIRKTQGDFKFLRSDPEIRKSFMNDLTEVIKSAPFRYVASIIDKKKLLEKYPNPYNPYKISLLFCMEGMKAIIPVDERKNKLTYILIESRGTKENETLELEFRRIINNSGSLYSRVDFQSSETEIRFTDKKSNAPGLQLADLIARPIALQYLRPEQYNQTRAILNEKVKKIKHFP